METKNHKKIIIEIIIYTYNILKNEYVSVGSETTRYYILTIYLNLSIF